MLLYIVLAFGLFFVANPILHLAGGYIMLFRTALNDKLSVQSKLEWMWVQTVFAPAALLYALLVEKNRAIGLAVGGVLVMALLGMGYLAMQVPWRQGEILLAGALAKMEEMKEASKTAANTASGTENGKPSGMMADPVIARAKSTLERLVVLQKNATDSRQKNLYMGTAIVVSVLKIKASKNLISDKPEAQTENQKIGVVLADLNARLDKGPLSPKDMQDWSVMAQEVLSTKQQ